MLMVVIGVVVAGLAHAAESFIDLKITAARETNAVVCLLTWLELPKEYQVVAYRVYQAEAVGGPFVKIAQTTTNELMFVVEPGKHFWKVVAVNFWNAEGEPSVVLETPPVVTEVGGVSMKKVKAGGGREKAAVTPPPPLPRIEAGTVDPGVLMDTGEPVTRSRLKAIPSHAKLPKDVVAGEKQETKD